MLVLARKVGQSIVIDNNIEITIIEVRGEHVRLGIKAPQTVSIYRKELLDQISDENRAAVDTINITPQYLESILGKITINE